METYAAEPTTAAPALKEEILTLVRRYQAASLEAASSTNLLALIEALLDANWNDGRLSERFEFAIAEWFGTHQALLVNSGSSANLVAMAALTSPRLGKLQLHPGEEVITLASPSSSLAAALIHHQLTPVFVDLALPGFNVDIRQLQSAITMRTRAIALPHLFGNPFDLDAVTILAAFHNLLLIEDCRSAAGARFSGRAVGSFGQFATASFHQGRQISMGEGGAVLASSPVYRSIAASFRDGGRGEQGQLQLDHAGYGLRASGLQAALGLTQLAAATAGRIAEGNRNAQAVIEGVAGLGELFILPETLPQAQPSWLELPLALRESAPFSRDEFTMALVAAGVSARPWPPSLATQPAFASRPHRTVGPLRVTNFLAAQGLSIAVPPAGAQQPDVAAIVETIHSVTRDLR